ncbi:MAG: 23S rRNA (adenine(2503)-C(2))-methyltransferase RlmN [Candidatus Pacebacteria bacterium]|nr:23S rRNA (adenine(2503)-C(2))-methyltransferase RlmN [Candidatus Paceibacterota bacterium]
MSLIVKQFIQDNDLPSYRLDQFNHAFYQELIGSFAQLTTWSKDLRAQLEQTIEFSTLNKEVEQVSSRGDVIKTLFSLKRNPQWKIEAVLMKFADGRNSVCVSSMSGCPVGCQFCATGQMGLQTNLEAREIIDQVLYFGRKLKQQNEKVTHVVYMGMGEPLLNLEAVEESLDVLMAEDKLAMSKRRITLSTVGYISQFRKLLQDGYRPQIAVSLHAPTQELRAELMPVAKLFPLDELMEALVEYEKLTNKQVTYEYILIDGVNDQPKQAHQLSELLENRLAHVNLIPYNPVPGVDFSSSSEGKIQAFSRILDEQGISNTVRVTMGQDIDAACGQLNTAVSS